MRKNANRKSCSFTLGEIQLACELLSGLRMGEDVRSMVELKEYREISSRFLRMRTAVREQMAQQAVEEARPEVVHGFSAYAS